MIRKASVLTVGVALLLAGATMRAHHSVSAEFDQSKPLTFTGTVTKVEWTNPHIYTHVATKGPDGKTIEYRVEGGPPNALFRQGWRKDSLKAGDTVTVSGIRAKREDSLNVGQATITLADGRKIFAGTGQAREAAQNAQ